MPKRPNLHFADTELPDESEQSGGWDDENKLDALEQAEERQAKPKRTAADEPLLTSLFKSVITANMHQKEDAVLRDFAAYVLTPMSDTLGMSTAKGGDFAREKRVQFEADTSGKMRNPDDYYADQTMRAHLLNGFLPVLQIARQLHRWDADRFEPWNWDAKRRDEAERLLIAGYLLHDYTKLKEVKAALKDDGFEDWHSPQAAMMPTLERIFMEWCEKFGLDRFLEPIGGAQAYLHDLIYIVHNTQVQKQTIGLPSLLPNKKADPDVYLLAEKLSNLADLIAYTARTPREMVNRKIQEKVTDLAFSSARRGYIASLTYHHVAENRGVLLNFVHQGALAALANDLRVPILYAPSGVVYLEHRDAPPIPNPDTLINQIVSSIRQKAGDKLLETGKGARRGGVNLQIDDSYNDYFDLPTVIRRSSAIVQRHIRSNKSADRLAPVVNNGWAGSDDLPMPSTDKTDLRLDQLAEWGGFIEVQLRERLDDESLDLAAWMLPRLGIGDKLDGFRALERDPGARKGGGIKFWWFWAAAHTLDRKPLAPEETLDLIRRLSDELADALPPELPPSAQINETKWNDLADYLARVFSVGGIKSGAWALQDETARYTGAKKRGGICALCGEAYTVTKPNETAVAFQPGVYTARVKLGASDNTRRLCSICSLEQLLRQLFVVNLDTGRNVEDQRVRYLSFYPNYFFTPETLEVVRAASFRLKDLRLSEGDLRRVLADALVADAQSDLAGFLGAPAPEVSDQTFIWTRLTPFMLKEADDPPSKRILRYSESIGGTFFTVGLRNFNDPSDIESWILPAFEAFIFAVALDLKVIISEGGVPLITESDELPEMLWFDGAHPAIRAVLDIGRQHAIDRLHVDELLPALKRLTAAYLIHLDTEFDGRDEHWQRFPALAHSLAESPLHVFHYLMKQERDDPDRKAITRSRVRRYLSYALLLADEKGLARMTIARELVEMYRGFYRADNFKNSNSILRPINVVADALLSAAVMPTLGKDDEALYEIAYGELYKFMDRVSKGLADGRFPKGVTVAERDMAMRAFCKRFVDGLYAGTFNHDASALRGKPINLIKNACEGIYRELQYAEWAVRGREADEPADESDTDTAAE
jgi:CRISPR-associated protein Csc3